MLEASKFIGINNNDGKFYDYYHKIGENSNMSIDSYASLQTTNGGGSVAMSVDNSSVGSNDSHTRMLGHQGLKRVNDSYSVAGSVNNKGRFTHALSDDALAQALMDPNFPTEGLKNFEEWTIDLGKLYMGDAFAQGAFGKLYRGTYEGEEVAIKLLERPENDQERAQLMEQQFQQEVQTTEAWQKMDFQSPYTPRQEVVNEQAMLVTNVLLHNQDSKPQCLEMPCLEGINVRINLNQELILALCNMLQLSCKEAAWELTSAPPMLVTTTPAIAIEGDNQVLH